MIVLYSRRGRQRLLDVDQWWRANRRDSPELFRTELGEVLDRLKQMGERIGKAYAVVDGVQIYKYPLKKTHQDIYYSIDRDADVLEVHSIWGSVRGEGPPLP